MDLILGKLPAIADPRNRTIRLSSIYLKELLPELPSRFNIDAQLGGIDDDRWFMNDQYGCCVIAGQAHSIFRFEKYEFGSQPVITDEAVKAEYLRQTGGLDTGLYMLNSIKEWRNTGWRVNGLHHNIHAFASVEWEDHNQVKYCIYLLNGPQAGMRVYQKDMDLFEANQPWELTGHDGAYKGGHAIYLHRYSPDGVWCMTWGRSQFMTWDFLDARFDENYGIVDDKTTADSALDVDKLDGYLAEIASEDDEESDCFIANTAVNGLNLLAKAAWWSRTYVPKPRRRRW